MPLPRLSSLPPQLHILLQHQCRRASVTAASSSTANESEREAAPEPGPPRFPFPNHPRPTPYQIFHLPYNASQREIKLRYYDLVRIHHPDSPHCRSLPPRERHTRFQTITSAYDLLRGKSTINTGWRERNPYSPSHPSSDSDFDPFEAELLRRRNAYWAHPSRQPGYEERCSAQQRAKDAWTSDPEYVWKDRVIILFGILSLVAGIVPGFLVFPTYLDRQHKAAAANLKQARSDAREFGGERMKGVRRRVQEIKAEQES